MTAEPPVPIVAFDNVGLRYGSGTEALSDISFTLWPGSFYFLTGASGAGKTSLLKLLYLAQRPSRGGLRMFGTDLVTLPREKLPRFRRRLGVVFQDFRLVSHLSAFDNVALPLRVSGVRGGGPGAPGVRHARLGRSRPAARGAAGHPVGRGAAARRHRTRRHRPARSAGGGRADRQRRSGNGAQASAPLRKR